MGVGGIVTLVIVIAAVVYLFVRGLARQDASIEMNFALRNEDEGRVRAALIVYRKNLSKKVAQEAEFWLEQRDQAREEKRNGQ